MLKHNEICKQFINKSGGKVIKDIGDAVFASFTSPQTVIQCANNVILSLQNCKKIENKDIHVKLAVQLQLQITISTGKNENGDASCFRLRIFFCMSCHCGIVCTVG